MFIHFVKEQREEGISLEHAQLGATVPRPSDEGIVPHPSRLELHTAGSAMNPATIGGNEEAVSINLPVTPTETTEL